MTVAFSLFVFPSQRPRIFAPDGSGNKKNDKMLNVESKQLLNLLSNFSERLKANQTQEERGM